MAFTLNNTTSSRQGADLGKTGDLSAARQAAAVHAAEARVAAKRVASSVRVVASEASEAQNASAQKPTRRSARGSDVVAREKKERREARKRDARGADRPSARKMGATRCAARSLSAASGRESRTTRGSQRAAMRYATDNRAVNWLYDFTTGPKRYLFYLIVVALIGAGVYGPVRDFYIAHRTEAILKEQKAIRDAYNESLGKEVEGLLSQEGIEDVARRDFGMVQPGEKTITVEGLDEDGNPVVIDKNEQNAGSGSGEGEEGEPKDPSRANGAASKNDAGTLKGKDAADKDKTGSNVPSSEVSENPVTSAEVEAAERSVLENSAWYWKVLDTIFGFDGVNGMAVVSTGE